MRQPMLMALFLAAGLSNTAGAAETQSVTGGGITLSSLALQWPTSDRPFPDGPGVDVVNSNCVGCHSPGMVLTQPVLSQSDWQAEVTKMRKVYKAAIDESAVPTIVGYLSAQQSQNSGH